MRSQTLSGNYVSVAVQTDCWQEQSRSGVSIYSKGVGGLYGKQGEGVLAILKGTYGRWERQLVKRKDLGEALAVS